MTWITNGMAVALGGWVNPRPEIVLPPGFSLRIDYDPAASPASLVVTAFHDEAPVGQAHLDPREVGLRLRLDVESDAPATADRMTREPRLRLTPRNAALAIEMGAIPPASEATAVVNAPEPEPPAPSVVAESAAVHPVNTVVWLENGTAVVLPSADRPEPGGTRWGLRDALRAAASLALELVSSPLRLPVLEPEGWASWRASWPALRQPSVAGDG